jgi:phosphate:Na+ symporter
MWTSGLFALLSLVAFIGGLRLMRHGMEAMAGGRLPAILHRFVRTPSRGILTGIAVTALIQSSAAITAISVGMVASGSIAFRDALGVVLGANVGSTITPQLLTLDLMFFVIPCLVVGLIGFVTRSPKLISPSQALVGFATIFISLQTLAESLEPLTHTPWFKQLLEQSGQVPLIALVTGTVASAIIQSSTATTVITMAFAAEGAIPLNGAIAIVIGANIGTCLTSVLAALGQSRAAQQVALSHVLLNVGGALLMMPFLSPFAHLMAWIAHTPSQQIANAHTIFNVLSTLLVWPVTNGFARVVETLLPDNRHA